MLAGSRPRSFHLATAGVSRAAAKRTTGAEQNCTTGVMPDGHGLADWAGVSPGAGPVYFRSYCFRARFLSALPMFFGWYRRCDYRWAIPVALGAEDIFRGCRILDKGSLEGSQINH